MKTKTLLTLLLLALSFGALSACGDDDDDKVEGEGTVILKSWGEDYIEEGIPADEMDDGWAIEFERFALTYDEVSLAEGVDIATPDAVDISGASGSEEHGARGHEVTSATVPAGSYAGPGFAINKIEVVGSATKGDVTKTFEWTFGDATHYTDCDTTVEVKDGEESIFEITIHADHLFGDSLVSHEPELLFGPLADADADEDGEITQEELEAADIGAYDPGSEGGVENLWQFLSAQAQTLGHVDGEGHCDSHTH